MSKVKEPETLYRAKKQLQTPKEAFAKVLQTLDNSITYDDMMYELYLLQKVERGLREIEEGKTVPHEEAKKRLQKWLQ